VPHWPRSGVRQPRRRHPARSRGDDRLRRQRRPGLRLAAQQQGIPATVFLPRTAPQAKVAKLRSYSADVRLAGTEYADAPAACEDFATIGALASHVYDHPLIAAGAGTLLEEIHQRIPGLDTIAVGGGLFAGVATAAQQHAIRTVAVEPNNCGALNAALQAGCPIDVTACGGRAGGGRGR
jgi:threonine dehydratase